MDAQINEDVEHSPSVYITELAHLSPAMHSKVSTLTHRLTGPFALVDEFFDKIWEFPVSFVRERTISRGESFLGDVRLDFEFNKADRSLCRVCGKHILKQKFATEHYQKSPECWKVILRVLRVADANRNQNSSDGPIPVRTTLLRHSSHFPSQHPSQNHLLPSTQLHHPSIYINPNIPMRTTPMHNTGNNNQLVPIGNSNSNNNNNNAQLVAAHSVAAPPRVVDGLYERARMWVVGELVRQTSSAPPDAFPGDLDEHLIQATLKGHAAIKLETVVPSVSPSSSLLAMNPQDRFGTAYVRLVFNRLAVPWLLEAFEKETLFTVGFGSEYMIRARRFTIQESICDMATAQVALQANHPLSPELRAVLANSWRTLQENNLMYPPSTLTANHPDQLVASLNSQIAQTAKLTLSPQLDSIASHGFCFLKFAVPVLPEALFPVYLLPPANSTSGFASSQACPVDEALPSNHLFLLGLTHAHKTQLAQEQAFPVAVPRGDFHSQSVLNESSLVVKAEGQVKQENQEGSDTLVDLSSKQISQCENTSSNNNMHQHEKSPSTAAPCSANQASSTVASFLSSPFDVSLGSPMSHMRMTTKEEDVSPCITLKSVSPSNALSCQQVLHTFSSFPETQAAVACLNRGQGSSEKLEPVSHTSTECNSQEKQAQKVESQYKNANHVSSLSKLDVLHQAVQIVMQSTLIHVVGPPIVFNNGVSTCLMQSVASPPPTSNSAPLSNTSNSICPLTHGKPPGNTFSTPLVMQNNRIASLISNQSALYPSPNQQQPMASNSVDPPPLYTRGTETSTRFRSTSINSQPLTANHYQRHIKNHLSPSEMMSMASAAAASTVNDFPDCSATSYNNTTHPNPADQSGISVHDCKPSIPQIGRRSRRALLEGEAPSEPFRLFAPKNRQFGSAPSAGTPSASSSHPPASNNLHDLNLTSEEDEDEISAREDDEDRSPAAHKMKAAHPSHNLLNHSANFLDSSLFAPLHSSSLPPSVCLPLMIGSDSPSHISRFALSFPAAHDAANGAAFLGMSHHGFASSDNHNNMHVSASHSLFLRLSLDQLNTNTNNSSASAGNNNASSLLPCQPGASTTGASDFDPFLQTSSAAAANSSSIFSHAAPPQKTLLHTTHQNSSQSTNHPNMPLNNNNNNIPWFSSSTPRATSLLDATPMGAEETANRGGAFFLSRGCASPPHAALQHQNSSSLVGDSRTPKFPRIL